MKVANQDVRELAAKKGVRLWQLAYELGMEDYNFSRKLRRELPADEKEKIFSIIERLAGEVR